MANQSIDALLASAIQKEIETHRFYKDLAQKASDKNSRDVLEFLAAEELGHKEILENYRNGALKEALSLDQVIDYKVAEHSQKPQLDDHSEMKDVYLLAAHKELNAYHFYMQLAEHHEPGETKDLLLKMANEEKKHKEKVEYYYTNSAFPETGI